MCFNSNFYLESTSFGSTKQRFVVFSCIKSSDSLLGRVTDIFNNSEMQQMSGDCTKVELISASPGLVDCDNKRFLT
jgi:hypothetical protein